MISVAIKNSVIFTLLVLLVHKLMCIVIDGNAKTKMTHTPSMNRMPSTPTTVTTQQPYGLPGLHTEHHTRSYPPELLNYVFGSGNTPPGIMVV